MSDFKAKYQALQILQRLASGEKLPGKGRGPSLSPRKPGVRNSDDILKEKYTELAELVALQHLEKQAVYALQNMYVSPPKGERRSRRRKRDGETRRRKRREDGEKDEKQRPLSASSSSSHSSSASFASRTSSMSNSSRASSMSHASRASSGSTSSRASSMSNASRASSSSSNTSRTSSMSDASRSSTKSKSSSAPKPVERHFVTIVEEEEEEEIINQDVIEERQIVQFDEDLAQENAEEARQEKEASKRTRRVSFVLETQEESSEDEDDAQEKESSHSRQREKGEEYSDAGDPTPRYIEIENSLLREILSPRSPRRGLKLSPRSEERSLTRDRSKSPKRKHRSPSPKRAWEVLNTVPLPPRPVKDAKPCDHKLSSTDNPEIKKWLRHKNALIRRERKAEMKEDREERRAAQSATQKRVDRLVESEEYYDTWVTQKKKDIRRLHRNDRLIAKEEKRRQEEEKTRRDELFQEKQRKSVASFGERVPSTRKEKVRRHRSGKASTEESNYNLEQRTEKEKGKGNEFPGKRTSPSSNPFKGVSYDEWMRQKMKEDEVSKRKERQKQKSDPDLENVIPSFAKERIERAKSGKGKRINTGLRKEKDERPECDRTSSERKGTPNPYTWPNNEASSSNPKQPQDSSGTQGRVGLQRPSTAKNHIRNASRQQRAPPSSSGKVGHRGAFSPSSARPEPQGSESNDDHSEHSANIHKGKPRHGNTERSNNNNADRNQSRDGMIWDKALVERSHLRSGNDAEGSSIFLTEFDG